MSDVAGRVVTIFLELNAPRPRGHASSRFCTYTALGHTPLGLFPFPKIDDQMGQWWVA